MNHIESSNSSHDSISRLSSDQIAHLLTHQLENENSAYFNFIYDQIPASFNSEKVNGVLDIFRGLSGD
jgi:hypothetical protein